MNSTSLTTAPPQQLDLDLQVIIEREIDGVGMGVLSNGTPYLNIRGLARMCGVDHSLIVNITAAWLDNPLKPREAKIRELVRAQGADDNIAFRAVMKNGTIHHIIPAAVCMAILEYYAFEARGSTEHAAKSFRILARKGFTDFIYSQVGYNPNGIAEVAWKQFHDRVSLAYHTVPDGHFSIFKEISTMLVTLINAGANLGNNFIPDISVGMAWGKKWTTENLDFVYGPRIKYEHNYPIYFPQAESNPQEPWCYPDEALPEFRKWVREIYIPKKMPNYLESKVKDKKLSAPAAMAAIEAFKPAKVIGTKPV